RREVPPGCFAPTAAFDEWLAAPAAERWVTLVAAWLDMAVEASPGLSDDGKRLPLLQARVWDAPGLARRRVLLGLLGGLPPGVAADRETLADAAAWGRPALFAHGTGVVSATLEEATLLGVTGQGALATAARHVVAGDHAAAAAALGPLLPETATTFTLQADLTAVVHGLLAPDVAEWPDLIGDVESSGAATVYRFNEHTL